MTKRRKLKKLKRNKADVHVTGPNPYLPGLLDLMQRGKIAKKVDFKLPEHVADGAD